MLYNTEQILEIENFSYLYLTKEEIAIVTGSELQDLQDPEHSAFKAFQKGRLMRKAEFNNAVINLTKQLSSPAMAIEQKIAESTYLNDLRS
jgi:hypothetical protein